MRNSPYGLYSNGMHEFVLWEAELGTRVAHALDNEQAMPGSWLLDLQMAEEEKAEKEHADPRSEGRDHR